MPAARDALAEILDEVRREGSPEAESGAVVY